MVLIYSHLYVTARDQTNLPEFRELKFVYYTFTGRIPFLLPKLQFQSTEEVVKKLQIHISSTEMEGIYSGHTI